ncbi:MAG: DUF2304 domain-containing protein [Thermodesulfobacteriota bacterium]
MTLQQKVFAVFASLFILGLIIHLVKKRRLREEYAWLWLLTGCVILLLVVWYDLLLYLTDLIGAVTATTTLFLFGIIFLMMITLHYAIKISALSEQVKNLAQQVSLMEAERQQKGQ